MRVRRARGQPLQVSGTLMSLGWIVQRWRKRRGCCPTPPRTLPGERGGDWPWVTRGALSQIWPSAHETSNVPIGIGHLHPLPLGLYVGSNHGRGLCISLRVHLFNSLSTLTCQCTRGLVTSERECSVRRSPAAGTISFPIEGKVTLLFPLRSLLLRRPIQRRRSASKAS